ncbi:Ubiquitin-conjugating enzyme 13 [Asimina triloba]
MTACEDRLRMDGPHRTHVSDQTDTGVHWQQTQRTHGMAVGPTDGLRVPRAGSAISSHPLSKRSNPHHRVKRSSDADLSLPSRTALPPLSSGYPFPGSDDRRTLTDPSLLAADLAKNPVDGFSAGLVDDSNIFEWSVTIIGPPDTLYDGGYFNAIMSFPSNYPNSPPTVRFTSEMWHPNVYPDGKVCISILHAPGDDPNGYELASERWTPVHTVESIVLSIISMLSSPNDESPANVEAAVSTSSNSSFLFSLVDHGQVESEFYLFEASYMKHCISEGQKEWRERRDEFKKKDAGKQ